jgi:hypothetical protein
MQGIFVISYQENFAKFLDRLKEFDSDQEIHIFTIGKADEPQTYVGTWMPMM